MEEKIAPNRKSISILGAVLGGLLGILIVITRESFIIKSSPVSSNITVLDPNDNLLNLNFLPKCILKLSSTRSPYFFQYTTLI